MATSPGLSPAESAEEEPAAAREGPEVETRGPTSHEQTVEAALAASTRAEATLGALYRAIQQVTQGVSGAREANDQLASELHRVREMLAASNEQRLVFMNQVSLLEQQLADARSDREFLIQEQDRFLAGLLEEHEAAVERLVRDREEAFARIEKLMRQTQETAPPSGGVRRTSPGLGDATPIMPSVRPVVVTEMDRNVEKLLAERDRSREVLRRLQQQRDAAQQALADVTKERDRYLSELSRVAPGRIAPPRPLVSPQDARRTQPAVPHLAVRSTDPVPPAEEGTGENIGERMTAPPGEELQNAIAMSRPSPPAGIPAQSVPTPPQKPPLKRKPDPAMQPLGGYSLRGDDESAEESVKGPAGRR
ncbi:MAG: hypothetical protein HS104_26230 [Polyangiaceae bacterium]|nr:hypothetical protein [Polyangiaceae bacterium]MCE7890991.1 hypothetical protein [Sorangiineae bacterium PRO1]MCL4750136.1 hypothetical protein [Myxococcales bacterium]MCL4750680.1 hypothetical protein [Myxococcales bacterium]